MGNTKPSPVLVVGASGKIGSELVRLLESNGTLLRASSRNPSSQQARKPTTQWVELDLDKPETFDAALEGVETAFLMARPGDERPEVSAVPLLDAMLRAGVRRVVNLTAMGCELRPGFGLRQVELALENSGMHFTHLRPNFFMQIFCSGPHFAQLFRLRQLRLPAADARISFIDSRDVAAGGDASLAAGAWLPAPVASCARTTGAANIETANRVTWTCLFFMVLQSPCAQPRRRL